MALRRRFLNAGERWFGSGLWHHVAAQPLIFFFLWCAALRITFTEDFPHIRFQQVFAPWVEGVWLATGLLCPVLALVAWWLIVGSSWSRSSLFGLWVRFGADLGQFTALLTFHVAVVMTSPTMPGVTEARIYLRYALAGVMAYVAALVVRDVWAIMSTNSLARRIRDQQQ